MTHRTNEAFKHKVDTVQKGNNTNATFIIIGLLAHGRQRLDYNTCTYIRTVNNHTIKYESMSLVVGEAIAYKRVFKPISPCKNNWKSVCRSG